MGRNALPCFPQGFVDALFCVLVVFQNAVRNGKKIVLIGLCRRFYRNFLSLSEQIHQLLVFFQAQKLTSSLIKTRKPMPRSQFSKKNIHPTKTSRVDYISSSITGNSLSVAILFFCLFFGSMAAINQVINVAIVLNARPDALLFVFIKNIHGPLLLLLCYAHKSHCVLLLACGLLFLQGILQ